MNRILVVLILVAGSLFTTQAAAQECRGQTFNPISDVNWQNAFPITLLGVSFGSNSNPPGMRQEAICNCPWRLLAGVTLPGIGLSFWEPAYLMEVTPLAGCLHSFGGDEVLSGYSQMRGDIENKENSHEAAAPLRQVHWIRYPIFALAEIFTQIACSTGLGVAIGFMSEIAPQWQSDELAQQFFPEGALFNTLPMQTACIADAIAAQVSYPIDPLTWCGGGNDTIFPISGNVDQAQSSTYSNLSVIPKFLTLGHRTGALWRTTYPYSECGAMPWPTLIKTQYRIDPWFPTRVDGRPIYVGRNQELLGYTPPPTNEFHTENLFHIWQGVRCCIRF